MKNRDLQLDVAKGIAIYSVVLGHLDTGLKGQIIYLFHMPFFFIISGYFHQLDSQEGRYLRKKVVSLLIPYFVYLLILKLPSMTTFYYQFIQQPSVEVVLSFSKHIAKLIYGGDRLTGTVGVFWFVTCLFITQQVFNFVALRVKNNRELLSVAVAFYGIACLDQIYPIHLGLPWTVNVVFCAFLFYAVGSLYGDYIFKAENRLLILLAVAISVFSILLIASGVELSFKMKQAYYGLFILSPLAAFSLTKLLSFSAGLLATNSLISLLLAFVGKASITIMFFHRVLEPHLPRNFPGGSIAAAIFSTAICCILHQVLTASLVSRALFLGSRRDFDCLTRVFHKAGKEAQ